MGLSNYTGDPIPGQDGAGGSGGGDLLGALIQTGGALYQGYHDRKTAKRNTDATIAANKSEAELAYQRSIEEWNRQNLYNSPEQQMLRYSEAGLNPNLIYGQGNSGNASSPPSYQPARQQYDYQAPNYGSAIQTVVPTLMQVGSWIQQMRLGQAEIQAKTTATQRSQQMIDYLLQSNPNALKAQENKLSLFPYQKTIQQMGVDKAEHALYEQEQEFRYKYGQELFENMGTAFDNQHGKLGGIKRLQFLQENSKTKLLDAKASWSEFDVTDPQQIIMMVLNGVMGLAGQTLRLSTHKRPTPTPKKVERPRGLVRRRMSSSHPDR